MDLLLDFSFGNLGWTKQLHNERYHSEVPFCISLVQLCRWVVCAHLKATFLVIFLVINITKIFLNWIKWLWDVCICSYPVPKSVYATSIKSWMNEWIEWNERVTVRFSAHPYNFFRQRGRDYACSIQSYSQSQAKTWSVHCHDLLLKPTFHWLMTLVRNNLN